MMSRWVAGFQVILFLVNLWYTSGNDKFFVYDWPDLVNRYANGTDRSHKDHGVEFPYWTSHFGAGRLIDAQHFEHKTSQFALFKLFYERVLLDPRRTLDASKAVSFFIPYDIGMDACFFESNGRMRKTTCPLAAEVSQRLMDSPYFHRNGGHDHTVVFSVNQNMNYFLNAKNCINFRTLCWNCTKLSIDEYMFIAEDRVFEMEQRGANWHAVPFPSDYHYNETQGVTPPWMRTTARPTIISFTGSPRRYNDQSTAIREALIQQCQKHPNTCKHDQYKHEGGSPNQLSRESVFCLQPPGDMPTRKSVFDAVLSGCIPVLFHPLTARYMYEWHPVNGQHSWEDIGLHFDSSEENRDLIAHKFDVIAHLEEIYFNQSHVVRQKQKFIRELAYNLQYSMINERPDTGKRMVSKIPGMLDAYELAMDKVLAIHAGRATHDRTAHYIVCQHIPTRNHKNKMQTADWCNKTNSAVDPFYPPSLVSPLYKESGSSGGVSISRNSALAKVTVKMARNGTTIAL